MEKFLYACENGLMDTVLLMISKEININRGIELACKNGHINIVNLLITTKFENTNYVFEFNRGLYWAGRGGYIDIVNLIISKAKDMNYKLHIDEGLYGACIGGHLELIELMSSKEGVYLKDGLGYACLGGHREIVELIISRCKKEIDDDAWNAWDNAFMYACQGGHLEIAKLIVSYGARVNYKDINCISECGHVDIVEYVISEMIKNGDEINWELAFRGACSSGHIDVVNLLISKGVKCWNTGLKYACLFGHVDVAELMISNGANNWDMGLYNAGSFNFIISKESSELYRRNVKRLVIARILVSKGGNCEYILDLFKTDIKMLNEVMNDDIIEYVLKCLC